MLQLLTPDTFERAMADPNWLAIYDRVIARQDSSRSTHQTWCETNCPELHGKSIAYFSAEFALHQSLPIYAGGLGVLAGRSEEHTSELQSLRHLVCRLLLEKKNTRNDTI